MTHAVSLPRASWLIAALVAGCGGDEVTPSDAVVAADFAPGAADSAIAVDLAAITDLPVRVDAVAIDLAIDDMREAGPDLASADLTSAADLAGHGFTWKLVGTLNRFPRDPSGVDYVGGAIRAPQDNQSWSPMTGQQSMTNLQIGGNFSRRGFACDCLINNHEYILGGGGDGVGGAWVEPSYCDVDYNNNKLTTPGSPLAVHGAACAAANNLCYVIGGSSSPNGPFGTAAARVFNPQNGMFAAGPPLPVPTTQAAVAVGGGKMLVAGGYCSGGNPCPPKNDPSGMDATVLDAVHAADVNNPAWQALPSLPKPVTGAGMVYLSNRFYLVGGAGSAFGPINPSGVLSLALGDNAWRVEAAAPGMGTVVSVMTDGAVVLAVVYQNFAYDLYRGTP